MSEIVFLYVTTPDMDAARSIARALVEEKYAACVNILGPIQSIYRWEGVVEEAAEIAMIVKTTEAGAPDARAQILAVHPYDAPCIAALPVNCAVSLPSFIEWIEKNVQS